MSEKPSATRRGRRGTTVVTPIAAEPPHSIEAEQSTLGGLMLDNSSWPAISKVVSERDFYEEKHRLIFATIRALAKRGSPFDTVTLAEALEEAKCLEEAGNWAYLGLLPRDTPSAANVIAYARIIKRKSLERRRLAALAKGDHHQAAAITAALDSLEAAHRGESRFLSITKLCSTPPAENWLIKGYIPTDSLNLVFGDPEAGKSFLLIDIACHVATGRPWRGQAIRPGLVLYIAGEGRNGLAKRFRAWFEHHGEEPRNIMLLTMPIQLTDPASMGALMEEIKALPAQPVLIIVDTVNRNFGPGDENSTGDMTRAVAGLDALRTATGAAIMGSHHCGLADKGRGRGSSVLRASLDCEFAIERFDRTVQIRCTKAKDFDYPPPLAWAFEQQALPWADEEGVPLNSAVLVPSDAVSRRSAAPMGKHERLALSILEQQVSVQPVQSSAVPGVVPVQDGAVPVTQWRTTFYGEMRQASPGIETNTIKQAWNRARTGLVAKGLVALEGINRTLAKPVQRYKPVQTGTCTGNVPVQPVHTPIGVYRCTDPCTGDITAVPRNSAEPTGLSTVICPPVQRPGSDPGEQFTQEPCI